MSLEEIWNKLYELADRLDMVEPREEPQVLARYKTAASPTMNTGAYTVVNFATVDFDPRSLVTTGAGWVFTAPVGGYYYVTAAIQIGPYDGWADTEAAKLYVYKNGGQVSQLDRRTSLGSASLVSIAVNGSDLLYLAVGDTLDVRCYQNSGANLVLTATAEENYISIFKV